MESLIENEKVQKAVLKELQDAGRQGGLSSSEIIDGVVLSGDEWTTDNVSELSYYRGGGASANVKKGLLTAAQKIQRKPILSRFQKEVDKAYGKK